MSHDMNRELLDKLMEYVRAVVAEAGAGGFSDGGLIERRVVLELEQELRDMVDDK